jgi:RNA polymerase sigma-70 factor (ECF subfamily)
METRQVRVSPVHHFTLAVVEEKISEKELVIKAKNGDKNAFKQLVKQNEHRVAATVIGMLGHCPEADDVGQEVFIRFHQALDKFRGESSIGTYLTRIAINLSLNELKRRKRQNLRFYSNGEEKMEKAPDRNDRRHKTILGSNSWIQSTGLLLCCG